MYGLGSNLREQCSHALVSYLAGGQYIFPPRRTLPSVDSRTSRGVVARRLNACNVGSARGFTHVPSSFHADRVNGRRYYSGLLIAILLPALITCAMPRSSRKCRANRGRDRAANGFNSQRARGTTTAPAAPAILRASQLRRRGALTPRLSVGTAEPESIYEAKFTARLQAVRPKGDAGDCDIELPLPPEIIFVGRSDGHRQWRAERNSRAADRKLVWHGALKAEATPLVFTTRRR